MAEWGSGGAHGILRHQNRNTAAPPPASSPPLPQRKTRRRRHRHNRRRRRRRRRPHRHTVNLRRRIVRVAALSASGGRAGCVRRRRRRRRTPPTIDPCAGTVAAAHHQTAAGVAARGYVSRALRARAIVSTLTPPRSRSRSDYCRKHSRTKTIIVKTMPVAHAKRNRYRAREYENRRGEKKTAASPVRWRPFRSRVRVAANTRAARDNVLQQQYHYDYHKQ